MYASAAFWDGIADKYAKSPIKNQESYRYTFERSQHYLSSESTVLELGCGTGSTALELAPSVRKIVATDIANGLLNKGRAKAQAAGVTNVEFLQSDAADAPVGPFDAVTAFNLLHLVPNLDEVLAEAFNRVKPGGYFISKTFCVPERFGMMTVIMSVVVPVLQMLGKAPYVSKMTPSELDKSILKAGFEIVEIGQGPTKDDRRFIVAKRPE